MKNGVKNTVGQREVLLPIEKEKKSSKKLNTESIVKDAFDQRFKIFWRGMMKALLNKDPVFKGNSSSGDQEDHCGKGHDPQPPQLEKNHVHNQTKGSEVSGCILNNQSRHTNR